MFYFILYLVSQLALVAAWVSGTLDPYQKRLQEILLDQMGETKVSYGLKSMFPFPVFCSVLYLSDISLY
jgi:hypothetical protein